MNIQTSLRKVSDKVLLEQTQFLVDRERADTLLILRHLREIELRRLFVDLGYSSMHKYCIQHLKYSEYETQMRLSSARLLTDLPEIEEQIQSGALNLTNLSQVQTFFRTEKSAQVVLDKNEKLDLLKQLQGKSTREVKKDLISKSHQPALLAEKFHVSLNSQNQVMRKFEVQLNEEHQKMLQEFRDLYAHELGDNSDYNTLMFLLKKATDFKKKKLGLIATKVNAPLPCADKAAKPQRQTISAKIKRQVWQKAQGCCEYRDKNTQARCSSRYALEIDHIKPVALEAEDANNIENLRLLCRAHNARRAVKTFGMS